MGDYKGHSRAAAHPKTLGVTSSCTNLCRNKSDQIPAQRSQLGIKSITSKGVIVNCQLLGDRDAEREREEGGKTHMDTARTVRTICKYLGDTSRQSLSGTRDRKCSITNCINKFYTCFQTQKDVCLFMKIVQND